MVKEAEALGVKMDGLGRCKAILDQCRGLAKRAELVPSPGPARPRRLTPKPPPTLPDGRRVSFAAGAE